MSARGAEAGTPRSSKPGPTRPGRRPGAVPSCRSSSPGADMPSGQVASSSGRWQLSTRRCPPRSRCRRAPGSPGRAFSAGVLAVEELRASVRPAPPTEAEFVTAAPSRPFLGGQQLCHEAGIVGTDDRHERRARGLERVDDDEVDARRPDAVEGRPLARNSLICCVPSRSPSPWGPPGDVDVRVLGERRA